MDAEFTPIFIVGIVFFSCLAAIKILAEARIKNRLIDKGMVDENIKYLTASGAAHSVPGALKWGMVLMGLGLAFLIGILAPEDYTGEVTVGSMFFLAGCGLIIYYFLAKRMGGEAEDK